MSYVSVYENKTPRAKGVILAGAVHAAIIAGVIAMPGIEIPEKFKGPIFALPVPVETPPKPASEEMSPEVKLPPQSSLNAPDQPIIDLPTAPAVPLENYSGVDIDAGSAGSGTAIPYQAVEIAPEPVVVEPSLNMRYAQHFQPAYPPGQLRLEREAVVSVRVLVGTDGRVKRIELIESPHEDFWAATRKQALRQWRFTAGTRDGKRVESWMTIKVRFEIKG